MRIILLSIKVLPEDILFKYDRKNANFLDIFTSCSHPGCPLLIRGREGPIELIFMGFGCDHEAQEVLEAQKVPKIGVF